MASALKTAFHKISKIFMHEAKEACMLQICETTRYLDNFNKSVGAREVRHKTQRSLKVKNSARSLYLRNDSPRGSLLHRFSRDMVTARERDRGGGEGGLSQY